jgi:hypothetical protein
VTGDGTGAAAAHQRLRSTFDSAAPLYQQARPEYPATLYDALVNVTVRHFDWEISYTAEEYIRLLDTFSGHIEMAPWQRDRLGGEIRRRLAERPGGRLRRHWGAVLHVARRRGPAAPGLTGRPGPPAQTPRG